MIAATPPERWARQLVSNHMLPLEDLVILRVDTPVVEAFELLTTRRAGRALVADEAGGVIGLVALSDLAPLLAAAAAPWRHASATTHRARLGRNLDEGASTRTRCAGAGALDTSTICGTALVRLTTGRWIPTPFATHRFPLGDAERAYDIPRRDGHERAQSRALGAAALGATTSYERRVGASS